MTKQKSPRAWMTAEEHDASLKETGQYDTVVERQRQYQEELRQRRAERDAALEPLAKDLRAAGAPSFSEMDGPTTPPNFCKAIPILLAHLMKPYPTDARSFIARALVIPETKAHWHELTRLYRDERDERIKGHLGCAISVCADAKVLEDVIALVRDKAQGPTRGALLHALEKSKDPRAHATIEELADEPDLREEIKAIHKRAEQRKRRKTKKLH